MAKTLAFCKIFIKKQIIAMKNFIITFNLSYDNITSQKQPKKPKLKFFS